METEKQQDQTEHDKNVHLEFFKIIKEFIPNMLETFPEWEDSIPDDVRSILDIDEVLEERVTENMMNIYEHSKERLPPCFFDILYKNETVFSKTNEEGEDLTDFIYGIPFSKLWVNDISETTKDILWKYLQLLLFTVITDFDDNNMFGETSKLFESINGDEFKSKLEEAMGDMNSFFKKDDVGSKDDEKNAPKFNMNDAEKMHEHINGMMGGKIGMLAKEIADETMDTGAFEFDGITEDSNPDDIFKTLFKDPTKLMKMTKNISSKLEDKIKSGELNESELMQEATEMMSHMKDMPGMGNMSNLFSSFGGKSKMNMGATRNRMNTHTRQAQTRDRMREKLKEKQVLLANEPTKPQVEEQPRTPLPSNNKKKKRGGKKKGKK